MGARALPAIGAWTSGGFRSARARGLACALAAGALGAFPGVAQAARVSVAADPATGAPTLTIEGDAADGSAEPNALTIGPDTVETLLSANPVFVVGDSSDSPLLAVPPCTGETPSLDPQEVPPTATCPAEAGGGMAKVKQVVAHGNQEDDEIEVDPGVGEDVSSELDGGEGGDTLTGGAGADELAGGAGGDALTGGGGSDEVDAGPGNDEVDVQDGEPDTVSCGPGTDTVVADAAGVDTIADDCEQVEQPEDPGEEPPEEGGDDPGEEPPPPDDDDTDGPSGGGRPPADRRAPRTAILDEKRTVSGRSTHYRFASNERRSSFECRLDWRRWTPCRSPHKLRHLRRGHHVFKVRAVDRAGNRDRTPARDRFRVRRS